MSFTSRLYVHSTDRTFLVGGQPLVHTWYVKQVHAWKSPDILLNFKLAQADCTFLLMIVVPIFLHLFVLVRKGVHFDDVLRGPSVDMPQPLFQTQQFLVRGPMRHHHAPHSQLQVAGEVIVGKLVGECW